jgi:hypothetical protein
MFDNYYEAEEISVKSGETVRFVVENFEGWRSVVGTRFVF